jgi:hypothetical protein
MEIVVDVSNPHAGFDGPWLHDVTVTALLNGQFVGTCDAKLIKEREYTGVTRHFFSAMDYMSETMGDLAHVLLWAEGRFDGSSGGKVVPNTSEERIQLRSRMDEMWRNKGEPLIRPYCDPVLFKPRPGTTDHIRFPPKAHWVLWFSNIHVAVPPNCNHDNIARVMVRMALEKTRSLAQEAGREFLAATEPGCVPFKRMSIYNPRGFKVMYRHIHVTEQTWAHAERATTESERVWLSMGFQKLQPRGDDDLSNWYFWNGRFDLPESKDIYVTDPSTWISPEESRKKRHRSCAGVPKP